MVIGIRTTMKDSVVSSFGVVGCALGKMDYFDISRAVILDTKRH